MAGRGEKVFCGRELRVGRKYGIICGVENVVEEVLRHERREREEI